MSDQISHAHAINQYRKVEAAVRERQQQKHLRNLKLQTSIDAIDNQRSVVDDLTTRSEHIAVQVAIGAAPEKDLKDVMGQLITARSELATVELTINALKKELEKIDGEVNPAQRPPLELAREAFYGAVFEEARDRILKNAIDDLRLAHVSWQMATGIVIRGDDETSWNLLIKTLRLPAPTREERVKIARTIDKMLAVADE